jgi:uncharacterized surface protein with fasciclin (FAS1) repeats
MKRYSFKYIFLLTALLAVACSPKTKRDDLKPAASQNIMEILEKDSKFSTLVAALKRTELDKQLASVGPYTIFAPNNEAFTATGITDINAVPVTTLTRILKYHLLNFRATSGTFVPSPITVPATSLPISTIGFTPTDNVFITWVPTVADEAPSNDNFFNQQVHAYMGCLGTLSINGIKVVTPDIVAVNGTIHEIGRVAFPPTQNLYDYISTNPDLARLKRVVDLAGLSGTLSQGNYDCNSTGCGAYTAFLPNNAAFAAAGFPDDASIGSLSPADFSKLATAIRYHLVSPPGLSSNFITSANLRMRLVFPSAVIANGQKFNSLSSPSVETRRLTATVAQDGRITLNTARPRTTDLFDISGKTGQANNAAVVRSDVMLLNGVAHIVDRMLDLTPQP